ncbi:Germin-like protein [Drosera capensis]
MLGLALLLGQAASDPEPLQDYCIADTHGPQTIHMNGPSCIDPELASPSHFATSALSKPGNTSQSPFGFNIILTNISNLPGLNTQGLTMARLDVSPDGLVPPHSHPRASEVTICLKGELLVGFVDTTNRLHTQQLRPGESFVFPKGLIHFMYNLSSAHSAVAITGLNSQNPGAQLMAVAAFISSPPLPDEVLEKAFKIHGQDVARIRRNLEG